MATYVGRTACFGKRGKKDGEFRVPLGIAVDEKHCIYVTDRNNHRVQVLDSQGDFLLKFGKKGGKDGEFNVPAGIAFDPKGNIYVADSGNHRIQKFWVQNV